MDRSKITTNKETSTTMQKANSNGMQRVAVRRAQKVMRMLPNKLMTKMNKMAMRATRYRWTVR